MTEHEGERQVLGRLVLNMLRAPVIVAAVVFALTCFAAGVALFPFLWKSHGLGQAIFLCTLIMAMFGIGWGTMQQGALPQARGLFKATVEARDDLRALRRRREAMDRQGGELSVSVARGADGGLTDVTLAGDEGEAVMFEIGERGGAGARVEAVEVEVEAVRALDRSGHGTP